MVYSKIDSSFVAGSISGKNGDFELKIKPGKYYATIQFIAYGTITINDITLDRGNNTVDLGSLFIAPDSALLDEIEIIADKSSVEMSLDKRVFNVGKDISGKAGNAIDVLENIPSITVDIDGNVSLRGDDSVRILIDGKVSGLAGINNATALRSIPSDLIDRIEIVTNPSVRYSAEGTSGIINIILKKDRRKGFNGSVDLSTGYPLQTGIGINTNYRLNKINLFANYNFNYRDNIGSGTTEKVLDYVPLNTFQESERLRTSLSNTFRAGAEYFFNPSNVLTLSFLYRMSDDKNKETITYNDYYPSENLLQQSQRVTNETESDPNLEYSLDYKKEFKQKDQLFTANMRYFSNTEDSKADITETVLFDAQQPLPEDD
ncbi:MAG: TonB-dependent receptor plug domain-containing protein, partial [Ignavibacteria bacterium]|nr:TonB-dependent receptor plug domain-containing protein [Ignavibacteria bacterium]